MKTLLLINQETINENNVRNNHIFGIINTDIDKEFINQVLSDFKNSSNARIPFKTFSSYIKNNIFDFQENGMNDLCLDNTNNQETLNRLMNEKEVAIFNFYDKPFISNSFIEVNYNGEKRNLKDYANNPEQLYETLLHENINQTLHTTSNANQTEIIQENNIINSYLEDIQDDKKEVVQKYLEQIKQAIGEKAFQKNFAKATPNTSNTLQNQETKESNQFSEEDNTPNNTNSVEVFNIQNNGIEEKEITPIDNTIAPKNSIDTVEKTKPNTQNNIKATQMTSLFDAIDTNNNTPNPVKNKTTIQNNISAQKPDGISKQDNNGIEKNQEATPIDNTLIPKKEVAEKYLEQIEQAINKEAEPNQATIKQEPTKEPEPVFKTFSKAQFYQRFDEGIEYKGEVDFNLNKTQRIDANLEAVLLTQKIFNENRFTATEEEQLILAKFSGFGGLSQLFNEEDPTYEKQRNQLKETLGDELYKESKSGILYSFYTPKNVINNIYIGLKGLGMKTNPIYTYEVLEPSCGIGNFITLAPANFKFTAVEKDPLTATIAKFLHPKTRIYNCGLEKIFFHQEFDAVVGNPPFANIKIEDVDQSYANGLSMHNYFAVKSFQLLKQRGLMALILSHHFADSKNTTHRDLIKSHDGLIANYIKLPNEIFSNTDVATDIIFFTKMDEKTRKEYAKEIANVGLTTVNNPLNMMKTETDYFIEASVAKDAILNNLMHKFYKENKTEKYNMNGCYYKARNFYYNQYCNLSAYKNRFGDYEHRVNNNTFSLANRMSEKIAIYNNNNCTIFSPTTSIQKEKSEQEGGKINIFETDMQDYSLVDFEKLKPGNIFEKKGEFYRKINDYDIEPVFFEHRINKEKLSSVAHISNKIFAQEKDKTIIYLIPLNDEEKETLRKILKFRDLLNQVLIHEETLPNDEKSNSEIMKEKQELIEMRKDILKYPYGNGFSDENEKNSVTQHSLNKLIKLETLDYEKIIACDYKAKKGKEYLLSDFFYDRTFIPQSRNDEKIILANNPIEALQKTINAKGKLDLETLQSYLPNMPLPDIIKNLSNQELIFPDLEKENSYVLRAEFLQGNIKAKYQKLIEMEKYDDGSTKYIIPIDYRRCQEFLKENFRDDLLFEDIDFTFGSTFIPNEIYGDFILSTFFSKDEIDRKNNKNIRLTNPNTAVGKIESRYIVNENMFREKMYYKNELKPDGITKEKKVSLKKLQEYDEDIIRRIAKALAPNIDSIKANFAEQAKINNQQMPQYNYNTITQMAFSEFLENTMNNVPMSITMKDFKDKKHTLEKETEIVNALSEEVRERFIDFIKKNDSYKKEITKIYNERYNTSCKHNLEYLGYLKLPTMNKDIQLRKHQENAIFKGILNKSMMVDHQVGAGKTLVGIALAMEQIRMGLVKKAVIVVPNNVLEQWREQIIKAYPDAKMTVDDSTQYNEKGFFFRSRYKDCQLVLMKHSTFNRISIDENRKKQIIVKKVQTLKRLLQGINVDSYEAKKAINSRINTLENQINKLNKRSSEIKFEDLGCDCLIVDEAHEYKNLGVETKLAGVKGIPSAKGSQKALRMYAVTSYMHENNFKTYFLTGTPVTNSIAEFFIMQQYIQPNVLKDKGLEYFDDWQKVFTRIGLKDELTVTGVTYRPTFRLNEVINIPELMNTYRENADIITNDDIARLNQGKVIVPKIKGGKPQNFIAPRSEAQGKAINTLIDEYSKIGLDPKQYNALAINTKAKKVSACLKMLDPSAETDYEGSKIQLLVNNVANIYHEKGKQYAKSTQLIFIDMGVSKIKSQAITINYDNAMEEQDLESYAEEKKIKTCNRNKRR